MSPALKARFVLAARLAALALAAVLVWKGPHIVWLLLPSRTSRIVVVDKTVPHDDFREHGALAWLLHALKVKRPDGAFYDKTHDYVGFDPASRTGRDLAAADVEKADVLFIADTYGVYAADYLPPGDPAALMPSRRLYGGMTTEEAAVVDDFSKRGGLVIGEFNTLASPTPDDARKRLEAVFGFTWTHWVARYWNDLSDDTELPGWVAAEYERIYKNPLDRTGGALVFVKEDDIVVMRDGVDLRPTEVLRIERMQRDGDAELAAMPLAGSYRYWLDVVTVTGGEADVLYEHVVQATDDGVLRMQKHGVPLRFPALLRRRGRAVYYFAGDFVDTATELGDPERAGLLWWRKTTHGDPDSEGSTFWSWYAPIATQLLEPRFHKK